MKYATILITILILVAVAIPGGDLPDVDIGGYDKLIHMGMFAVWAITVRYDFKTTSSRCYLIFLTGLLFSFLTEIAQVPIEGRSFDLYDTAADAVGLLAGLLASGPVLKFVRRII
jgi:VanZ family protein